jgi:hypothetical protein
MTQPNKLNVLTFFHEPLSEANKTKYRTIIMGRTGSSVGALDCRRQSYLDS